MRTGKTLGVILILSMIVLASCGPQPALIGKPAAQMNLTVQDLGPGEPFIIEGGMHGGHQSLRWPALALTGTNPLYRLNYNVCLERAAHPGAPCSAQPAAGRHVPQRSPPIFR